MTEARVCSIEGCGRPRLARGWCEMHYGRWKRHGSTEKETSAGKPRPHTRGENHYRWKGGQKEREQEGGRVEYRIWRATVYLRDRYRCVLCASKEKLQAHHIRPWQVAPDRRYDPDNGVTLCGDCHAPMSRREAVFVDQFLAYVATREPVILTPEQRTALEPWTGPCDQCGKQLVRPGSDREKRFHFCDRACKRGFEAEHGNNWYAASGEDRGLTVQCGFCGKGFRTTVRSPRRFCSTVCTGLAQRQTVAYACAHCGRPLTAKRSRVPRAKYCSRACLGAAMAAARHREHGRFA